MNKYTEKKHIRQFNTSGTCNPISDFYVSRSEELQKALENIKGVPGKTGGKYFTMFASRQMGKTTFIEELVGKLDKEIYEPVVISFETMIDLDEKIFYRRFSEKVRENIQTKEFVVIDDFTEAHDFDRFVQKLQTTFSKKLILIIDEFDGLNKDYLGKLLHTFREIYFHRGDKFNLHSLILVGVRNITDVNMDNASPFNTNDEMPLPLFTKEQVFDLMNQYEEETGQPFVQEVKEAVYYNTKGQPGLSNALCKFLVEDYNPGGVQPIDMRCFNRMISFFIHGHISKNVVNVINKAKKYKEQVIRIFDTQKKVAFNIDTDWMGYLYINGAIDRDVVERDGEVLEYVKFANPIYQKKIYHCFKPDLNQEDARYISVEESFKQFINSDQSLNILGIMQNYQKYVNQRGSKAFAHGLTRQDGCKYEAVYHYSLDAYMSSVAEAIGAASWVEFPTGNGKTDIFLQYKQQRYVIEIKSFRNQDQIVKAKEQAVRYAQTEGLNEAYLVIFTEVHPRDKLDVYVEETIDNITVRSVLVNVNFEE